MMDFFKSARGRSSGYTVIIGCGRLGASLANAISDKEASVMMVDRDERAFRKLGTAYGGLTLTGDATDISVLRSAEIERNVYHIPNVICRLYDPEREIVYKEFGIDTICPTVLSTREIDRLLGKAKGEKEA